MSTQAQAFTSNGSWLCPAGVSAVWSTYVGGGGGSPGDNDSAGSTGGAGSGEICIGRLMPVTPGNTYSVVIGSRGIGSLSGVQPTLPGDTTFNGSTALKARPWVTPTGSTNSGGGGGAGGSIGIVAGAGVDLRGVRECMHYTGGCGGTEGSVAPMTGAVNGGVIGRQGTGTVFGGASGGAIWGATNGANEDAGKSDASPTSYGAGAGGSAGVGSGTTGGNGCAGYALLMWVAP